MNPKSLGEDEEAAAANLIREKRWKHQLTCIYCSSKDVVKNGKRKDQIQQYRCLKCDKSFNDRSDTVFATTQMSLIECFYIIESRRSDKSIRRISKDLNRSWKTVNDFIKSFERSLISSDLVDEFSKKTGITVDYSIIGCGNPHPKFGNNNHLQF